MRYKAHFPIKLISASVLMFALVWSWTAVSEEETIVEVESALEVAAYRFIMPSQRRLGWLTKSGSRADAKVKG